jgi:N-acetyl-alpha-D-muramate 1-phosphate uridylyltransferase
MPARIKKAMLLAAGYGTRLKPLTNRTPKPLVPVAGRPMIDYALDKLRAYGIKEIVINVSHLKTQLVEFFAAEKNLRVTISEEAEPLETGGGLKKAEPYLGDEPIFAINSDILWTDDGETALHRLAQNWDDAKMDFLLLAQSKARAVGHDKGEDHLFINPENTLDWNAADAPYIISGIGIFHPRVLREAPAGKFSVKILWLRALAQNRLFCLPHHGRWFQTGTLEDIAKTEAALKNLPPGVCSA